MKKLLKKKNEFNTASLLVPVARHSYSLGHISLAISMIMTSVSLRCTVRTIDVFFSQFCVTHAISSWYSSRLWLLKLGYYKLNKPKEIANDWLWIIDHSIQLGSEKCLVILGIRQKNLPNNRALNFSDVEPIKLLPVTKSNGDIVYEQLLEASNHTGIPRAIIADEGLDLKRGINKFLDTHLSTYYIYDIKHHVAIC